MEGCLMRRVFFLTLFFSTILAAQAPNPPVPSANDLVRKIVKHELEAQSQDHVHWMFQVVKRIPAPAKTRTVIETKGGNLDYLEEIDGHPLTPDQRRTEDERIDRFVHDPGEQRKARRASSNDDEQSTRLFSMLPDAFIFTVTETKGDTTRLTFQPNPDFHSHSAQEYVMHKMDGFIVVNTRQKRLVEISGRLTHGVEFAGGLLGHLDPGGTFDVRQQEIVPGLWEITKLKVDMHGRVLFFKTIGDQEDESHSQFRRLADDITLADAEQLLQKQQASTTPAE
jgi:hypothetical protein